MNKRHHIEDCYIERDGKAGQATLRDEEGTEVFRVPSEWTDDQIARALDLANRFYDAGIQEGKRRKESEIRAALGIAA
ncbi:hypothetical protein [Burkholderia ubonensis]|nr:hypothetical protein [Burkholderia ubonensis]